MTDQDEPTTTTDLRKAAALLRDTPSLVVGSVPLAAWLEEEARRSALPFNEGDCDENALDFARALLTRTTGNDMTDASDIAAERDALLAALAEHHRAVRVSPVRVKVAVADKPVIPASDPANKWAKRSRGITPDTVTLTYTYDGGEWHIGAIVYGRDPGLGLVDGKGWAQYWNLADAPEWVAEVAEQHHPGQARAEVALAARLLAARASDQEPQP